MDFSHFEQKNIHTSLHNNFGQVTVKRDIIGETLDVIHE